MDLRLTVNGEELSFTGGTLESLLLHIGIDHSAVVAEVNGEIILRDNFSPREEHEGDVKELFRFVGGG